MSAYPTVTDRQGREYHLLTTADLPDLRRMGKRERAGCPIHGSDRQRSLSIVPDGEDAGFGQCFNGGCQARVLVTDMNPEAAARLLAGAGEYRERRITAADLLRPAPPRLALATPADWQRDELAGLLQLAERMRARLADERPRAYLAARGIPYEVAAAAGVGYIPADARLSGTLAKWCDRLIFPLGSSAGRGYIGRSLWGWQLGIDENEHKRMLDSTPDAPARWRKTNPAGWFNYEALTGADLAVIVEGAFDALALLACGDLTDLAIVALAGTACEPAWLPPSVRGVVLALDGDKAGGESAQKLRLALLMRGVTPALAVPPVEDGRGKDWSERWRVAQWDGLAPVFGALDAFGPVPADPSASFR